MARSSLNQLYALTIPEIQEVFLKAMENIVDRAMLDEMVKAIEDNDPEALFRVSGFTPAALNPIIDRIEQAYNDGADYEVSGWPKRILTPSGTVIFQFNMRNYAVEQDLRKFSSNWITNITNEVKENIRISLEEGMRNGDNPRTTALNIVGRVNLSTRKREGGVIGLSSNQLRWVSNTKNYLEELDERYFNLKLRDKRFDATVRKAIDNNENLSKKTIEKLLTSYKARALRYRGEVIARTETLHSISRGRNASYIQAIEEGTLTKRQITKEWDDVGDGRERLSHVYLGNKYGRGKGIGFDEAFITQSGARLMYPGDNSLNAPLDEIIQCRCRARYRVDWFKEVDNE